MYFLFFHNDYYTCISFILVKHVRYLNYNRIRWHKKYSSNIFSIFQNIIFHDIIFHKISCVFYFFYDYHMYVNYRETKTKNKFLFYNYFKNS